MAQAKHKDHSRTNYTIDPDDTDADASILPQVSIVPVTAHKKKEEAQSKKVSWHSGVRSDDSSADGTYDDMTVDTEVRFNVFILECWNVCI